MFKLASIMMTVYLTFADLGEALMIKRISMENTNPYNPEHRVTDKSSVGPSVNPDDILRKIGSQARIVAAASNDPKYLWLGSKGGISGKRSDEDIFHGIGNTVKKTFNVEQQKKIDESKDGSQAVTHSGSARCDNRIRVRLSKKRIGKDSDEDSVVPRCVSSSLGRSEVMILFASGRSHTVAEEAKPSCGK